MASFSNRYKFFINGIFIGKCFKSFLNNLAVNEIIKVHSVFHRVINLQTSQGLFTIASSEIGRHSSYIVVTTLLNEDFLSIDLNENSSCIFSNNYLIFDDKLYIVLNNVKPWEGILDRGFKWKLEFLKNESLLCLKAALRLYGKESSIFERLFIQNDRYLSEAVRYLRFNCESQPSAFKLLIGYGPGLTPAGDDFITGYMAVLNSCSDYIYCRKALREGLLASLQNTNFISGSMLYNAANNIYHEHIQNLIYAVASEEPEVIFSCAKKLIAIGATSGSDLAAGIYLGFLNAFELIGRQGGSVAY